MGKAIIEIEKGRYVDSVKNGNEFTSVNYDGRNYGGGSPCDSPEEIEHAIICACARITAEGDTYELIDLREKQATLDEFH